MFFRTAADFRRWLRQHHASARELLVGYHRTDSGKPSITWPESVDQALCFGWIDGIRKRLSATSYTIRFTPRRVGSIWSAVNIAAAHGDAAALSRQVAAAQRRLAVLQRPDAGVSTYGHMVGSQREEGGHAAGSARASEGALRAGPSDSTDRAPPRG
jgi:hypothetical protein